MSAPAFQAAHSQLVTADTPITVKISIDGSNRKFKIPLRDVAPATFSDSLKSILAIPFDKQLFLERFSDSADSYTVLDPCNPPSYKQLYRAAKAKLKLRLRAVVLDMNETMPPRAAPTAAAPPEAVPSVTGPSFTQNLEHDSAQRTVATRLANLKLGGEAPKLTTLPLQPATAWQVCCNNCDKAMSNEHYHCGTCDDGDYDLCIECVNDKGIVCPGDDHWLIKRSIRNGQVVNSTTERLAPKPRAPPVVKGRTSTSGSFVAVPELPSATAEVALRTCNACVTQMDETRLLNCKDCPDFDICIPCLKQAEHGHHPGHSFQAIGSVSYPVDVLRLSAAGQSKAHHAICDGCNTSIFGVRHKCLDCPDWDFCQECHTTSTLTHKGHRFVPVYDAIVGTLAPKARHFGIYCDGPLCANTPKQSYIQGARYKCAICPDTDFCANCEAHPSNQHNKSHPLLKFHNPVRNATISTFGEDPAGRGMPLMGDRVTTGAPRKTQSMAAGQSKVQPPKPASLQPSLPVKNVLPAVPSLALDAHFVRESIPDGSCVGPGTVFKQSWTLRNPGPLPWPAGVAVHSTGGDRMINIDPHCSASVASILNASRSNETPKTIEPGEEFTFTVKLRTPAHEGKQISYWRAKLQNGEAFGHKLWCDVEVKRLAPLPASGNIVPQTIRPPCDPACGFRPGGISPARFSLNKQPLEYLNQPMEPMISEINRHYVNAPQSLSRDLLKNSYRPNNAPTSIPITASNVPGFSGSIPIQRCAQEKVMSAEQPAAAVEVAAAAAVSALPTAEPLRAPLANDTHVNKAPSADTQDKLEGSQMVFPTLEKESPSSSMYEDASKEPTTEILASAPAHVAKPSVDSTKTESETIPASVDDDTAQDFASVEYDESESDDEMFLTDEEYDILDASDEEIMSVGGRHS